MIIAVDASGGDYAPYEVVKGAIKAAQEFKVQVALVGRKDILRVQAGRYLAKLDMTIVEANSCIGFNEHPVEAVSSKLDSSIVVGTKMVKDGAAQAFISAGSTGAVFYSALLHLGKINGIDRPAIGTIININPTAPVLLIDSGANADCRPNHLVQFARLGTIYARGILGIASPRIGLLNVGEEPGKGNKLAKETYELLKKSGLNFIGNVEGHDLAREKMDIVVTDGFTGNIVIKTIEGLGDTFLKTRMVKEMLSRAYHPQGNGMVADVGLTSLIRRMNYREHGGATLLGINGNVIIAHGRSQSTAIKNAIALAMQAVSQDICARMKEENYEADLSG